MKNNMVTVIGLGEIGLETLKELCKKRKYVFGVDISQKRLSELKRLGYQVGIEIPKSNIYIIAVFATGQVLDVVKKLPYKNKPLIVVESTVMPGTYKKLLAWGKMKHASFDLVMFPHRYNPGDPTHHVFNLTRVMGGKPKAIARAMQFYGRHISQKNVHLTTGEIAEFSKPLENAYRFLEISIAEELAMLCTGKKIDFKKLRQACNSKWNIDIKEARDGINGKCLPKDIALVNDLFGKKTFFSAAVSIDKAYKKIEIKNSLQTLLV